MAGLPPAELSYIPQAIEDLSVTLSGKNHDYKIDGEFSNFEFAANVADLLVEDVMLTQIGIKLGRLKGLADAPYNEGKLDTYKDLAGYAIILYAYALKESQ